MATATKDNETFDETLLTSHWVLHRLLNYRLSLLRLTNSGPFGQLARQTCISFLQEVLSDPDRSRIDGDMDSHQGIVATKMLIALLSPTNPRLNTVELTKLFQTLPAETVAEAFDSFAPPMLAGSETQKERLEQYKACVQKLIDRRNDKLRRRQEQRGDTEKLNPTLGGKKVTMESVSFSEPFPYKPHSREGALHVLKIIADLEKKIGKTF